MDFQIQILTSKIMFLILCVPVFCKPTSGIFKFLSVFQNQNQSASSSLLLASPKSAEATEYNTVLEVTSEFGEQCETNGKQCNGAKFLECIDGKCLCKDPLRRVFDENLKECVSLASSKCGQNNPPCVRNSHCIFGACQCQHPFSETTTKVCLLNRGMQCRPNQCNGEQGLACIKGTCQCIDSVLVFKPFSNRCVDAQEEFDNFARTVGKDVVRRVVASTISRTVNDATSLASTIAWLPIRLLIPVIG